MKSKSIASTLAFYLAVIAFTPPLRADLVMEQKMEGIQNTTMTLSIKGDRIRTDIGKDMTSIMDIKAGTATTLMHAQKMAMTTKVPVGPTAAPEGKPAAPAVEPKRTGKTEKINGRSCEIVTMELPGAKTTMWIDKAYPNYDKLKKELENLAKANPGAPNQDLGGVPVKTVVEAAGTTSTVTLLSIKQATLDDSLFKAPADYKSPGAGGQ